MAHQKKIDTVHWTYGGATFLAATAGTVAALVYPAQHLPETLLRTRGELLVTTDGTQAPAKSALIGVGLILVPEGTGTTVLWSPVTDGDAPWFWIEYVTIGHEELVTDVLAIQALLAARIVIDSKAMRKVRNREVQCVVENVTEEGAINANVFLNVRVLAGS